MIVLWVFSLIALALYTLVVFRTDFEFKEGIGVVKWLVIASLMLIIFTVVWMGAQIWLKN